MKIIIPFTKKDAEEIQPLLKSLSRERLVLLLEESQFGFHHEIRGKFELIPCTTIEVPGEIDGDWLKDELNAIEWGEQVEFIGVCNPHYTIHPIKGWVFTTGESDV